MGLQQLTEVVKVIDVSSNMLEALPASLSGMHKLERMIAPSNQISEILCQMSRWTKLKVWMLAVPRALPELHRSAV